ncbi:hypothetical protein [Spiroplasma alleghenense]|uniref:Lipoprotein n=1 Tax=Spiroplasma alleghenense TaxID=216931 RepID=A0A345Z526_9MOLU|nr:hypothetical protein [Spiroplasma alleghenense]AXK51705.1 hypothetical protein SALLE_v1c10350 [Spiroplasma alleghenense]
MKKLLNILAASTMVISAPLSVVACNKKKTNVGDEFDYDRLTKEFIDEITTIFKIEIANKFDEYRAIEEKELPNNWSLENVNNHKDEFDKNHGEFYNETKSWIEDLIPSNEINNAIKNDVLTNVNYNPILLDKNTPLKDGFEVEEIDLKIQKASSTLTAKITSNIYFKSTNDEKIIQPINTFISINIFSEEQYLNKFKEADAQFSDLIENQIANNIIFHSDSGNINQTAVEISQNNEIKDYLKEKVISLKIENVKINPNNLEIKAIDGASLHAGYGMFFVDEFERDQTPYQTFIKALSGDLESEKILLENITGNDAQWLAVETFSTGANAKIDEAINSGEKIARGLNQYALSEKTKTETIFKNLVSKSKSAFKIDDKNDAKIIATFSAELSNLKFSIFDFDDEYSFANKNIFIKQNITESYDNTLEYYNDFLLEAWNFHKEFFTLSQNEEGKNIFTIQSPKNWKKEDFAKKTFTKDNFFWEELAQANEKANSHNKVFNFTPNLYVIGSLAAPFEYQSNIYISSNLELFDYYFNVSKKETRNINKMVLNLSLFPEAKNPKNQPFLNFNVYNKSNSDWIPNNANPEKEFENRTSIFKLKFND